MLDCQTDEVAAGAPLDIDLASQVAAFGRRYVTTDSVTALQYYMLAAALAGGGRQEQGRLFRELLVHSKDYGGYMGSTDSLSGRSGHADYYQNVAV